MTERRKRTREETKQATRDALLGAGMKLFAEKGLDGPSLDAICQRAGKTRGAFYVHFRDRDDFLAAVMDRVGLGYLDALFAGDRDGGTHADAVPDLLAIVTRFVQLLDACARNAGVRARYVGLLAESVARITRSVQVGQDLGLVRRDVDGGQLATVLLATVIGAHTLMELRAPFDPAQAAAVVMTLLAGADPSRRSHG
jgi:TetR/AcrR family transcriptional regulator, transcriptional repressor for nem operon